MNTRKAAAVLLAFLSFGAHSAPQNPIHQDPENKAYLMNQIVDEINSDTSGGDRFTMEAMVLTSDMVNIDITFDFPLEVAMSNLWKKGMSRPEAITHLSGVVKGNLCENSLYKYAIDYKGIEFGMSMFTSDRNELGRIIVEDCNGY